MLAQRTEKLERTTKRLVWVLEGLARAIKKLGLNSACVRSRTKVVMKSSFGSKMNFLFGVSFLRRMVQDRVIKEMRIFERSVI